MVKIAARPALQDHLGDALRALGWYAPHESRVEYVRDDVDDSLVTEYLNQPRPEHGSVHASTDVAHRASLTVLDAVIVLRFPVDDTHGVIATADLAGIQSIDDLVTDCTEGLPDEVRLE